MKDDMPRPDMTAIEQLKRDIHEAIQKDFAAQERQLNDYYGRRMDEKFQRVFEQVRQQEEAEAL